MEAGIVTQLTFERDNPHHACDPRTYAACQEANHLWSHPYRVPVPGGDELDHAVDPSFPSIRPGPHRVISGTRKIHDLVADRLHELQGRRLGSRPPSRAFDLSLPATLRRRPPGRETLSRHRLLPQTVGLAAPWTCGGSSTTPPSSTRGHARRIRRRPLPGPSMAGAVAECSFAECP